MYVKYILVVSLSHAPNCIQITNFNNPNDMRLHRFYINEKIGSKKELVIDSTSIVNQITRVLRLDAGDKVIVFDGSGNDFECEILPEVTLSRAGREKPRGADQLRLAVHNVRPSQYMPERKIILYQAIIKKDKFEWVVEKATELGVTDIVPVITERSEKKDLNMERLNKIAIEASEQCGRGDISVVHSARLNLKEVFVNPIVKDGSKSITGLAFHTNGTARLNLKEGSLAVFIGPEGGWSPSELEMFHNNKIQICSLGNQVLRAETAAIVALSKLLI